jgi:hypothetical protein
MRSVETMNRKDLVKYIVAFLYGDGSISLPHAKECRFEASCIIDNEDYVLWRKSILEELTPVRVYIIDPKMENRKLILQTSTRIHPLYTQIKSRVYHDGKKTLDPHYLKLFDWETLAILYMDNGSLREVKQDYKEKHYTNKYPNIATMNFNYAENLLLKETIKKNLGIEFNINKHSTRKDGTINYMLCMPSSSRERFYKEIGQYILPSFRYKLDYSYDVPPFRGEDIVRTVEQSTETGANDLSQTEMFE